MIGTRNPGIIAALAASMGHGPSTSWDGYQRHMEALADRRKEDERKQAEADLAEYALIREKKSRMSARERDAVLRRGAARLGVEVDG